MTIPAEILHGELPLLLSDTETEGRNGELDTLTLQVLASFPGWRDDLRSLGYVRNEKISGYHAMFVEDFNRSNRSETACEVAVQCLGLLEPGEKRRRNLGVNGQQIPVGPLEKTIIVWEEAEQGIDPDTGDPVEKVKRRVPKLDEEGEVEYKVIATPSGSGERWNVRQQVVTVTDTYFATSKPTMLPVGTATAPPNAPAVPSSPWGSYNEPMRFNHPNGWVLDDRQVEELFPEGTTGGLWAVTDTYGYYLTAVPD